MTAAPAFDEVERLQHRLSALEQERKHLLAVIEILQEISGTLHFADIVQSVALRLGETFGLDRCSIFLPPSASRAIQTGETVFIADAATDPSLSPARGSLTARRVKSITAIPISWRGTAIGAILLRTFRDGPAFSNADLQFCQVVANLTAKALRNAHRFEKLRQQRGENGALRRREREQAALIGFLRNLLSAYPPRAGLEDEPDLTSEVSPEIGRLSGVAQAVLSQEAASR